MIEFSRPSVVISRCNGFYRCRWNGDIISSELMKRMRDRVNSIPVCPEGRVSC